MTSPQLNDAQRAEERLQAYEYRLLGWSLRRIGEAMGCSHEKVRQLVAEEIEVRVLPKVEELRQQQLDRLDLVTAKLLDQLAQDKSVARNAEVLIRVEERKAKLLGADAPVQQEITATVESKPAALLSLIEQARQKVAEEEAALKEGE